MRFAWRWRLAFGLLAFGLLVSPSSLVPALSEDKPELTREQLETQVSIMQDYIKTLESPSGDFIKDCIAFAT
jgi:hypothetical protein